MALKRSIKSQNAAPINAGLPRHTLRYSVTPSFPRWESRMDWAPVYILRWELWIDEQRPDRQKYPSICRPKLPAQSSSAETRPPQSLISMNSSIFASKIRWFGTNRSVTVGISIWPDLPIAPSTVHLRCHGNSLVQPPNTNSLCSTFHSTFHRARAPLHARRSVMYYHEFEGGEKGDHERAEEGSNKIFRAYDDMIFAPTFLGANQWGCRYTWKETQGVCIIMFLVCNWFSHLF